MELKCRGGGHKRLKAFTLAEVLITLVIIGVVAALTIPTVLKNYNDKKYNTARLKALKTFGEAGKMTSINGEINGQENARAFVENVLSKYLKIVKVCDNDKASECNFPIEIQPSNPTEKKKTSDALKTWQDLNGYNRTVDEWTAVSDDKLSVYITTADGFSAKLFYNPKCANDSHEVGTCSNKDCNVQNVDITCLNVIYDMNGTKKPNHIGDDIGFVTTFWSGLKAVSVAPGIIPYSLNEEMPDKTYSEAVEYCSQKKINKTVCSLPNVDEISSLYLNRNLMSMFQDAFWSGSIISDRKGFAWRVGASGYRAAYVVSRVNNVWCVRR